MPPRAVCRQCPMPLRPFSLPPVARTQASRDPHQTPSRISRSIVPQAKRLRNASLHPSPDRPNAAAYVSARRTKSDTNVRSPTTLLPRLSGSPCWHAMDRSHGRLKGQLTLGRPRIAAGWHSPVISGAKVYRDATGTNTVNVSSPRWGDRSTFDRTLATTNSHNVTNTINPFNQRPT